MSNHPVVSRAEWVEARRELLAKEKERTRLRDELTRQRRELPYVRVQKSYLFEGVTIHLAHRDATLVALSRVPYVKLAAYRQRMGWTFPWLSSHGSDFNFDFQVSYTPEQVESGNAVHNYGRTKVLI